MQNASGYVISLIPGTNAQATVLQNELESIGGTISSRVDESIDSLASVELIGSYTPSGGFTGTGSAILLAEKQVGEPLGDYTLFVEQEIPEQPSRLPRTSWLRLARRCKLELMTWGTRLYAPSLPDGMTSQHPCFQGQVPQVLAEKQLAELGGQTLFLAPGPALR